MVLSFEQSLKERKQRAPAGTFKNFTYSQGVTVIIVEGYQVAIRISVGHSNVN